MLEEIAVLPFGHPVYVISYLIYDELGSRDMAILKEGIEDFYDGLYGVNILKIDDEMANIYGTKRGWRISFMFCDELNKEINFSKFLLDGFEALRINAELLEETDVILDV
jgi:hypothetical protein